MSWFRSHRRPASWAALFAVLLQFALSFGHVHPVPGREPATITAAAQSGGGTAPHKPASRHHDDDYCAICAVIAMLSGAQTASAPVIAPPVALAANNIPVTAEAPTAALAWGAFRSRAPPQS